MGEGRFEDLGKYVKSKLKDGVTMPRKFYLKTHILSFFLTLCEFRGQFLQ